MERLEFREVDNYCALKDLFNILYSFLDGWGNLNIKVEREDKILKIILDPIYISNVRNKEGK